MRLTMIVVAVMFWAQVALGAEPATFTLERHVILQQEQALAIKLTVVVPQTKGTPVTRLFFRWKDEVNTAIANGMHDGDDKQRRAEVVILGQVTGATKQHPAMLLLTTQQQSKGNADTAQSHKLDKDAKISDVLVIDVQAGTYKQGEKLRIGTLGGEPVYLYVGPVPAEEGAKQPKAAAPKESGK